MRLAVVRLETPRDKSAGKKEVLELELELRRLVDPTSSRGSVALKVDPHHGRSTDRAAPPTRRLGSNVLLLLDHPEDPLLGSSDLGVEVEATAATANIAEEEEEIVALRRGSNPEGVTTAMVVTEVVMVDTLVDMEEEVTDKEVMVLLPEAQLLGSNRMPAMVLQAWTATACLHLLRRPVEFRHHRLLATSRRLHRPHRSSGLDLEPLEECVDGPRVLACGVAQSVNCNICAIEINNTRSNLAVCLPDTTLHDFAQAFGLRAISHTCISLNFKQAARYASIDQISTSIHATRAQEVYSVTCNN
jgi:hypothetical protein